MYSSVFYRVILVWLAFTGALGLGGCTVYDAVFHPHRLGTPAMTPEAKAKLRAAEKARHKGLSLQPTDADATSSADGTAPSASATPASVSSSKAYSELPAGTRATYDKQGLLKKSMLVRLQQNKRQLHHYDLSAPPHTAATRDERKMRKHSKNPGKKGTEPKAPAEPAEPQPAPDPTQPEPTPAATAAKPARTNPAVARPAAKTLPPRPAKAVPKPRQPQAAPQAPAPAAAPATELAPEPAAPVKKAKKDKKSPKEPKPDPTQPLPGGN